MTVSSVRTTRRRFLTAADEGPSAELKRYLAATLAYERSFKLYPEDDPRIDAAHDKNNAAADAIMDRETETWRDVYEKTLRHLE